MNLGTLTIFSSAAALSSEAYNVLIYGGLLILAIIGGGLAIVYWVRRSLRSPQDEPVAGFSIDNIEELRNSGLISDEEFRNLRTKALGVGKPAGEKDNSSLSYPPLDDDEKLD